MTEMKLQSSHSIKEILISFIFINFSYLQKGSNAKADAVNATVKVEFGEKSLGESPKVDCTAEVPAEFNYNATMSCTYDDPTALDEIATKPVVCKCRVVCHTLIMSRTTGLQKLKLFIMEL